MERLYGVEVEILTSTSGRKACVPAPRISRG
jgi:hypothetical protein